jgi:hypothetical protein
MKGSFNTAQNIEQYGFQQYQLGKQKLGEMKKKIEEENRENIRILEQKLKRELEQNEMAKLEAQKEVDRMKS